MNRASLTVRVCTNTNGAVACSGTGTGTPPADPEPTSYVLASVDVRLHLCPRDLAVGLPGAGNSRHLAGDHHSSPGEHASAAVMHAGQLMARSAAHAGQTLVEFSLVTFHDGHYASGHRRNQPDGSGVHHRCQRRPGGSALRRGPRVEPHGAGANGPSGPGNNPPQVVTVIKNFASAGLLSTKQPCDHRELPRWVQRSGAAGVRHGHLSVRSLHQLFFRCGFVWEA